MKKLMSVAGLALAACIANADTISLNPNADTFVRFGVNQTTNFGTSNVLDMFANTTIRDYFAYVRFDLSAIPVGAIITEATLTFTKVDGIGATRNDGINTGRFAVYGLNDVAGNTAQNWSETTLTFDSGRGSEWTAVNTFDSLRVTNLDGTNGSEAVSGTASGSTASVSGVNVVSFLQTRFDSASMLATFIVDQPGTEAGRGYGLASREYASVNAAQIPVLNITYTPAAVPEPSAFAAIAGVLGLGFAASRRRRAA